ncbi:hypothetical protein CAOG_00805 [Capsaspora owczarzaki ATCC 30864]|uniref:F-box domain-containing protein n=1 Tax=Capsaspora owczarzaki (strain ATCC 30864) TaxID=595528 RepID=A0A0D2WJ65_CAPO3|nr:hypothetical protein CAOG_00805 [Capsaspora owczarzaki ATCC 30864]KJE89307.1 hypothetical protein CAOG_000805 [Capsaspora owczarzaki ATCC 30864]KJE89308.1 hypothetical protein, variant [Capsaspora owczarzaki ATCC 30864]|eukprot:XP_004365676.1 hypothetical protein CAOG_00805 [Capsaspora owczarzaki ATCC 30864]
MEKRPYIAPSGPSSSGGRASDRWMPISAGPSRTGTPGEASPSSNMSRGSPASSRISRYDEHDDEELGETDPALQRVDPWLSAATATASALELPNALSSNHQPKPQVTGWFSQLVTQQQQQQHQHQHQQPQQLHAEHHQQQQGHSKPSSSSSASSSSTPAVASDASLHDGGVGSPSEASTATSSRRNSTSSSISSFVDPTQTELELRQQSPLLRLPPEILAFLCMQLDVVSLGNLSLTCRMMYHIGSLLEVWYYICKRDHLKVLHTREPNVDWRLVVLTLCKYDPLKCVLFTPHMTRLLATGGGRRRSSTIPSSPGGTPHSIEAALRKDSPSLPSPGSLSTSLPGSSPFMPNGSDGHPPTLFLPPNAAEAASFKQQHGHVPPGFWNRHIAPRTRQELIDRVNYVALAFMQDDAIVVRMTSAAHKIREYGAYKIAEGLFQHAYDISLILFEALALQDKVSTFAISDQDVNTFAASNFSRRHHAHGSAHAHGHAAGQGQSSGDASAAAGLHRQDSTQRPPLDSATTKLASATTKEAAPAGVPDLQTLCVRALVCQKVTLADVSTKLSSSALAVLTRGCAAKRLADALYNLSLVKGNQGRLTGENGAKRLRERSIVMYKATLGSEREEVANATFALADIHYVLHDYSEALPLYEEALRIRQKLFAEDSEEMAQTFVGLGLAYDGLSEFDLAEQHYLKALPIRERIHGPSHPKVARVCVNLGALYKSRGELQKTIPLYERALAIRERWLGPDHPYTARVRENLRRTKFKLEEINNPRRAVVLGEPNPAAPQAQGAHQPPNGPQQHQQQHQQQQHQPHPAPQGTAAQGRRTDPQTAQAPEPPQRRSVPRTDPGSARNSTASIGTGARTPTNPPAATGSGTCTIL